jgi:hypothetical protein
MADKSTAEHRYWAGDERNMPFYQTNPPFFGRFFDVSNSGIGDCDGNALTKSVGSFWKTNPPEGCFKALSGCGDGYFA